uniref:BTB domain-containing protein n=1 Tax=Panagrolaimus superbus TaxID=310955 RepID=A0A914YKM2_9BILA
MFESNMKEAKENQMFITDFSHEIVEAAIKLCYHQNLTPSTLSVDNKMLLLLFFDKYDIQHPKEYIETAIISEISNMNVCNVANFALYINSTNLQVHCAQYLRNCLKISKPISDFDSLNKEFAMNILKNSFCHISRTI